MIPDDKSIDQKASEMADEMLAKAWASCSSTRDISKVLYEKYREEARDSLLAEAYDKEEWDREIAEQKKRSEERNNRDREERLWVRE